MRKILLASVMMACFAVPSHAAAAVQAEKPYVLSVQQKMVEVPVLTRNVDRGAMIQSQDIEWAEIPENKLRRGTVTEEEAIVGKLAKRRMKAGEQVSQNALVRPRVIEKGGLISMIYRTQMVQIKDMGVAMEDGSDGDVIRVKNEKSGKIVLAKVQKNGEVVVNFEG